MATRYPSRLLLDALAWAAVQVGAGFLAHRLPDRWLERDRGLLRERAWERDGAFYVDALRIRRWKHLLPEAGAVFPGGFDKRSLGPATAERLERHVRETRRAEVTHWLAMAPTPVFVACNPPPLAVLMPVYAIAVNGPCIAAQRYNRFRLARVLRRASRP